MGERVIFDSFPVEELSDLEFILEGKNKRCTAKQRQYIHAMLNEIGMSERDALYEIGKGFLSDNFESPLREITIDEAGEMIEMLQPLFYQAKNENKFGYSSNRSNNNKVNSIGGWF